MKQKVADAEDERDEEEAKQAEVNGQTIVERHKAMEHMDEGDMKPQNDGYAQRQRETNIDPILDAVLDAQDADTDGSGGGMAESVILLRPGKTRPRSEGKRVASDFIFLLMS